MPISELEWIRRECRCDEDIEKETNYRAPKKICYTLTHPCPPSRPLKIEPIEIEKTIEIRQPKDLFNPVGIEEITNPTFEKDIPPWLTIEKNDKFEREENDIWFSKPNATPIIPGCMDVTANNYNPLATQDDGSCTYNPVVVLGCMDITANNYNPLATQDDGSCTYNPVAVLGCMDVTANNYNPLATQDDGSCTYNPVVVLGCMDITANNYNPLATQDDGSCTYNPVAVLGCMDVTANNYNPLATQDDGSCTYNPASQPTHYTPAFSRNTKTGKEAIEQATIISQATGPTSVVSQDPDGIKWVAPSGWVAAQWDGIPLDITGKTKEEICTWLKGPNTIRGLRERFYEVNPFADNKAPTVKEIENWNLEVIRHFRRLLGINIPVRHNAKLYLECAWADERKGTEVWDIDYPGPGPIGSAEGPCDINNTTLAAGHCGDSFFPNSIDRGLHISEAPYNNDFVAYPELSNYTSRYSQAVGLAPVNTNIPWSIKFGRIISGWICSEGLSGHPGPYVNPVSAREEFGCSWFISPTNQNLTGFRGKWH